MKSSVRKDKAEDQNSILEPYNIFQTYGNPYVRPKSLNGVIR